MLIYLCFVRSLGQRKDLKYTHILHARNRKPATFPSLVVSVFLFYLSVFLFYLSVHLSVCLSVCLKQWFKCRSLKRSNRLSICPSVCLSFLLHLSLFVRSATTLYTCLSVHLPVCLFNRLSACWSIRPSTRLSV